MTSQLQSLTSLEVKEFELFKGPETPTHNEKARNFTGFIAQAGDQGGPYLLENCKNDIRVRKGAYLFRQIVIEKRLSPLLLSTPFILL